MGKCILPAIRKKAKARPTFQICCFIVLNDLKYIFLIESHITAREWENKTSLTLIQWLFSSSSWTILKTFRSIIQNVVSITTALVNPIRRYLDSSPHLRQYGFQSLELESDRTVQTDERNTEYPFPDLPISPAYS